MLSNQITVDAAGADHVVMGGNMRRVALTATCQSANTAFLNIGRPASAPGGQGSGWVLQSNLVPIQLTWDTLGDAITGEVHLFGSGANIVTITEFFKP